MGLSKIFAVVLVIGLSGCGTSKYKDECAIPPASKNAAASTTSPATSPATPPVTTGKAILKVSQGTLADAVPATKVLVDKKLVCELQSSKDCSVEIGTGCQAVTLDNALDPGNFSRIYLFEDGKTYQFEADTDWGVTIANAVGAPIPLGAMFAPKGGRSQVILKLMSVKKTGE